MFSLSLSASVHIYADDDDANLLEYGQFVTFNVFVRFLERFGGGAIFEWPHRIHRMPQNIKIQHFFRKSWNTRQQHLFEIVALQSGATYSSCLLYEKYEQI